MLRFLRIGVTVLGVWIVGLGLVIALSMRDPGPAVWDTGQERVWTGTVRDEPYPMLLPDDGSPPLLIVEMAKRGAQPRVAPFAGRQAEVRGFLLSRDGRRMIELAPDDGAITARPGIPRPQGEPVSLGRVALDGEIVDGKCYLGAMKPGDGMTHKSCATLCVRGGLPPMIVTRGSDGPEFSLLVVEDQPGLPDKVLALIAEQVRVEGELFDLAGMRFVRAPVSGIRLREGP